MAQITNYQLQLKNATYIDVNSSYTINNLPDRVPDELSITQSSLFNLLNCMPGQRGRIFEPTYGSMWMQFLEEPICVLTAQKMRILMIQSIEKWVPQITVDLMNSGIKPDLQIPGYLVTIAFTTPFTPQPQQVAFQLQL